MSKTVPRLWELRSAIETALRPTPAADAELRRLSEAATPGPYSWDERMRCVVTPDGRIMFDRSTDCDDEDRADAAFIVAAVNAVREQMK